MIDCKFVYCFVGWAILTGRVFVGGTSSTSYLSRMLVPLGLYNMCISDPFRLHLDSIPLD